MKNLKGKEGVEAYRWAKQRSSDHVVHTEAGDVGLFDQHPIDALAKLSDEDLSASLDFYILALEQYLVFESGSTVR